MKRYLLCVLLVVSMLLSPVTSDAAIKGLTEGELEDGTYYAFIYVTKGSPMAIKNYNGVGGDVVIPYRINGYDIANIGYGAYADVDTIKSVILPTTLTGIGGSAFAGCDALEKVVFTGRSELGGGCFAYCSKLKEINLPDSLRTIPDSAFAKCAGLTSIRIPSKVELIDYHAFDGCTSLKSVVIPKSCYTIEDDAFANCTSLSEIYITNGDTKIGDNAFLNVTATVYYNSNSQYWTEDDFQNYGGNLTWVPTNNIPVVEDPGYGKYPEGVGNVTNVEEPEMPTNPKEDGDVVVVLNPMHDSTHAGIVDGGYNETDINLKIAQYCYEELYTYSGVKVYLTRTDSNCPYPETCGQSNGEELDELKRIEFAKSVNADAYISIHLVHGTGGGWSGATVHGPLFKEQRELSMEAKNLTKHIQNNVEALGIKFRGYTSSYATDGSVYADGSTADESIAIRKGVEWNILSIIIKQCTLIDSPDAENHLSSEAKLKELGIADAAAIASYYGLEKGYNPNKDNAGTNSPSSEPEKEEGSDNNSEVIMENPESVVENTKNPTSESVTENTENPTLESVTENTENPTPESEVQTDITEKNTETLETKSTNPEEICKDIESDNKEGKAWPIVLVVVAAGALCVAAVVVIWRLKIKKRK